MPRKMTIPERYEAKRLQSHKDRDKEFIRHNQILKDNNLEPKQEDNYKRVHRNIQRRTDLIRSQNHKCAICGRHISEMGDETHWDHCHTTGKIRGALCLNCNYGLGHFKDNEKALEKAASYIKFWKEVHAMKSPYQYTIVNEIVKENNRRSYQIRHVAKNGGVHEEWIGRNKLKRYIEQGRISNPPEYIPRDGQPMPTAYVDRATNIPNKFPNDFIVEPLAVEKPTSKYYIVEQHGMFCIRTDDKFITEFDRREDAEFNLKQYES